MEEDPRQLYSCVASSMGRRLISKASGTAFSFLPSLSQYSGFLLGPVFRFFLFFLTFAFCHHWLARHEPKILNYFKTQRDTAKL